MEQHFVDPQSVFHMEQTRCGSPKFTKLLLPCRTAYRKLSEALSEAFGNAFGSFRKLFRKLSEALSGACRKPFGSPSEPVRKHFVSPSDAVWSPSETFRRAFCMPSELVGSPSDSFSEAVGRLFGRPSDIHSQPFLCPFEESWGALRLTFCSPWETLMKPYCN